jgi:aminodeoxyfutalosine deaminase
MSYKKFKASHIFDGYKLLDPNCVLITTNQGKVVEILNKEDAGEDIQLFDGIISPGFINSHCHLELSYLKSKIAPQLGMVNFLLSVIQNRAEEQSIIEQQIETAENEMIENGIVAVADICNTTNTIYQKSKQNLYYHNCIEVAGFVPNAATQRFKEVLMVYNQFENAFPHKNSLVPHAPYSVSQSLLQLVNQFNGGQLSTIHHQESEAENEFFKYLTGDFVRLYQSLGVDISFFKKLYSSSSNYYLQQPSQATKTILVHNTFTTAAEVEAYKKLPTQFFYCLCVLSNEYISSSFPKEVLQMANTSNIVVGTDSLASNTCLNILSELQAIKKQYNDIDVETLLSFATINGAKALGIEENYGSFEINKKPGIVLIENFYTSSKPKVLL